MSIGWARPVVYVSLVALVAVPAQAADDDLAKRINDVIGRPEYKQARWGILIVEAESGKTIYERESERLFIPASTTKLFSCATALALLGPEYRFVTPVHRRGEVKDGKLQGDLVLLASGDLTFGGRTSKDGKTLFTNGDHIYANSDGADASLTDTSPLRALDELAQQVAKSGITEVMGEILVDDRLFNRSHSTGTGPDIITSIIVNDNMLDIIVTPGKRPGDAATVKIRPETSYYQVDAEVRTTDPDEPTLITLRTDGPTSFSVRGAIASNSKPAVRTYFVEEPGLFARALFIEALRRQNIRIHASPNRLGRFDLLSREAYLKLPRVAEYASAPLADAIKVTLKVSHNLYASTLPLLVAAKFGERNLDDGLRRQRTFLKELGVPVETISFGGAAGGDNADAITPAATIKLLQAMAKRSCSEAYFDGLPILGVDGTLADVISADSPAKGKVRAKTGTLVWYDRMNERVLLRSKALAGRIEAASGANLYVAIFLNDMPLPSGVPPAREGKVLAKLCEIIQQHAPK
jgi:D-alanyl-D-alanine carboxypeptidase/D-alanyl-D-alanine-endopeptidase (penicillin-binding protein 4)